jgi:SpoIIAA-like
MIKPALLAPNILKVVAPTRLSTDDFEEMRLLVDPIVREFGSIRLLIDASALEGWNNIAAFEKHAGFVKSHQQMVERVAVIAPHEWQHWLVGAVRVFLHPHVRAFERSQADAALRWIEEKGDTVPTAAGQPAERIIADIADRR